MKLELTKERILEAADKYPSAAKVLEVLFPELFNHVPRYEVGKWYYSSDAGFIRITDIAKTYNGWAMKFAANEFDHFDQFDEGSYFCEMTRPVTDEELKQLNESMP